MSEDNPPGPAVKKAAPRKGPKIPKRITEKHLYNAGLAYLQRFPSSTAHFKAVMSRRIERSCRQHKDQDKEACLALLEAVTGRFAEMGYLNDELYLRGMVTSLRGRGLSSMAILMKLKQKGLNETEVRDALAVFDDDRDGDLHAALKLCRRKKIGPFAREDADPAHRQKWLAALARGGFSYEQASRALDMPPDEAESVLRDLP